MRRWTINPIQFVRNLRQAIRLGVGWRDRLTFMKWFYHEKAFVKPVPGCREFSLRMPHPVGNVRLAVRDNGPADRLVFGEVLFTRDYEIDLDEPETILDLGGNIGLATLYFARRWPKAKLAVVEPVESNLMVLRRNLELNGVDATVFPNAVAVNDGKVTIAFSSLDCAHHIVTGDNPNAPLGSVNVIALCITTIMDRLGWNRIGLLKVDIEGYESILFRENSQWLDRIDAICLEAYDKTISAEELLEIAAAHGFEVAVQPNGIQYWKRSIQRACRE